MEKTRWWTKARGLPLPVYSSWHLSLAAQPERPARVLAWATTDTGVAVASPSVLSYDDVAGRWSHLGWHEIERGGWDEETGALTWQHVDQTRGALALTEPGRLPEVFRERVAASIVLERLVPVRNGRGVLISGRRDLADAAAAITWNTSLQRGLTWQMEGVRAAVDEAVAQVRREYDMG
jgi:hypothetical protein